MKVRYLGLRTGILLSTAGALFVTSPTVAHADSITELETKKEAADKKIEELEKQIQQTTKWMEEKQNAYKETEKDIQAIQKEKKIVEERIQTRKEILETRLITLQAKEDKLNPYLEVLLGSESLSDFFGRIMAVSQMIDADNRLIRDQKEDKALLERKERMENRKREKLNQQFQELQEEHEKLEIQKLEQEALLSDLEDQIQEAKRLKLLQEQELQHVAIENFIALSDTPPSKKTIEIMNEASKYLGWKYTWGGAHPSTSFDCSGLMQWSFKQAGIHLPRTSAQQYMATQRIAPEEVKPGDLVFFSYGKGVQHVGLYVGGGKMLNSQNSGIKVEPLQGYWAQYIVGFGRVKGVQEETNTSKEKKEPTAQVKIQKDTKSQQKNPINAQTNSS